LRRKFSAGERGFDMSVLILCYHSIHRSGKITPEIFEENLKSLQSRNYSTATLDEIYDHVTGKTKLPEKTVHLTFDDGYRDNYTEAFPIMKKYPFKATIFLPTVYLGNIGFLNWEQIREMKASNIVDFESHTHSHPRCSTVHPSKDELVEDILLSKKIIMENLEKDSRHFCYPFGYFDDLYVEALKTCGFKSALTLQPGVNCTGENPYLLRRVEVKKPAKWLDKRLIIYSSDVLSKIYGKFTRRKKGSR
jgi:peptidoglycan/xylan/chitin deacetylase (PgdA/CDA1 family)